MTATSYQALWCLHGKRDQLTTLFCVNRFYPKTQLSWLARLDHSHCNSADPLTDGLEVCCVFYRPVFFWARHAYHSFSRVVPAGWSRRLPKIGS